MQLYNPIGCVPPRRNQWSTNWRPAHCGLNNPTERVLSGKPKKPLSIEAIAPKDAAALVAASHTTHAADKETGRQTLVVVNKVQTAQDLFQSLQKHFRNSDPAPELRLVHSRFRPFERANWIAGFLSRESLGPEVNRIVVATQVVEAGVDISASCLITELALGQV